MSRAIAHRGPDGCGYLVHRGGSQLSVHAEAAEATDAAGGEGQVALAHRRLSIIDVAHRSDQPMIDQDAGLALAYNGELYNFRALRAELEAKGHRFSTSGDTEVVLRAYREWGAECFERFVGMWALALLDVPRGRLLLSRDRFGIKPLFYARTAWGWAFASEIKALLGLPGLETGPHAGVVAKYLVTGLVDDTDQSFFTGVHRVPAAHNLSVEGGWAAEPAMEAYWRLRPGSVDGDGVARFREAFEESVRIHAESDVPVGSCLSGGLDSSAIVCVAERLRRAGDIPSYGHRVFGYAPEEHELSEERYMRAVADQSGALLTVVTPQPSQVEDALRDAVAGQDEPFVSSSIVAQWFVFAAAADGGVKVMLDGQGADELLAGYHWYFRVVALMQLQQRRFADYARFAIAHRREYARWPLNAGDVLPRISPRLARAAAKAAAAVARLGSAPGAGVGGGLHASSVFTSSAHEDAAPLPFGGSLPDSLGDLLWRQFSTVSLPALLRYEDRNSMAHSIEARVPFLDHRLVELAFSLPDELRLNGVTTKYVLRRAVGPTLPQAVLARKDKIGFRGSPQLTWSFAAAHEKELNENIGSWEERWFETDAVSRLLRLEDRSDAAEGMLWRTLNAKLWLRQHWPAGTSPVGPDA